MQETIPDLVVLMLYEVYISCIVLKRVFYLFEETTRSMGLAY
jgi:hypothetical protein